jgi:hypothetical protein
MLKYEKIINKLNEKKKALTVKYFLNANINNIKYTQKILKRFKKEK